MRTMRTIRTNMAVRTNGTARAIRNIRPNSIIRSVRTMPTTSPHAKNQNFGTHLKWKKIVRETSSETSDRPWPIITR